MDIEILGPCRQVIWFPRASVQTVDWRLRTPYWENRVQLWKIVMLMKLRTPTVYRKRWEIEH